jgi:hypothetical protein
MSTNVNSPLGHPVTFIDRAKILIDRGIPVVRVSPRTKKPFDPAWQEHATTDLSVIKKWDAETPNANTGAAAYAKEGAVFFFEVDSPDLIAKIEAETGQKMPATFLVEGQKDHRHFYFLHTNKSIELGNVAQEYGPFSVRANNEIVVGPKSIHPKGMPYEVVSTADIATIPDWLVDWIRDQKEGKNGKKKEAVRNEAGLVPVGSIHPYMLREAGRMRAIGLNGDEIEPALLRLVHENCVGPIDDSKVVAMAHSVEKYEPLNDARIYVNGKLFVPGIGLVGGAETKQPELVITDDVLDQEFPAYDGKDVGPIPCLVEGFLPKGANFFGSLSGVGKTWLGLSVSKALTSGEPLFGVFPVKEKTAVLYLIPEASDGTFKNRMKLMRITRDRSLFRYRTVSQGATLRLRDPLTIAMIKKLRQDGSRQVLVVVDTAIRFLDSTDENSSTQNSLVADSDYLRSKDIGADLLFMHHSPKESKKATELTLENVLRGTGDFGAMADVVYGIRRDENLYAYGEGPEELEVVCVKPRDLPDPPLPFRVVLKRKDETGDRPVSVINEIGDVLYVGPEAVKSKAGYLLDTTLRQEPYSSLNALTKVLKMRKELVKDLAKARHWVVVAEIVFGVNGETVKTANGLDKKRFKWTQILRPGETIVKDEAILEPALAPNNRQETEEEF